VVSPLKRRPVWRETRTIRAKPTKFGIVTRNPIRLFDLPLNTAFTSCGTQKMNV